MVEGGVLERGEDTSSIGSAKEQTDAEGDGRFSEEQDRQRADSRRYKEHYQEGRRLGK